MVDRVIQIPADYVQVAAFKEAFNVRGMQMILGSVRVAAGGAKGDHDKGDLAPGETTAHLLKLLVGEIHVLEAVDKDHPVLVALDLVHHAVKTEGAAHVELRRVDLPLQAALLDGLVITLLVGVIKHLTVSLGQVIGQAKGENALAAA